MRLVARAGRFLADVPSLADEVRENMAHHMAHVHLSVTDASVRYYESERRYNYTTPKSYLELISLYKGLLARKRDELRQQKERLENGVLKISQASAQVADLQAALKHEQAVVDEKKQTTDALIVNIGQEKAVVDEQKNSAAADEAECAKIATEVSTLRLSLRRCAERVAAFRSLLELKHDQKHLLRRLQTNESPWTLWESSLNLFKDHPLKILLFLDSGGRVPGGVCSGPGCRRARHCGGGGRAQLPRQKVARRAQVVRQPFPGSRAGEHMEHVNLSCSTIRSGGLFIASSS